MKGEHLENPQALNPLALNPGLHEEDGSVSNPEASESVFDKEGNPLVSLEVSEFDEEMRHLSSLEILEALDEDNQELLPEPKRTADEIKKRVQTWLTPVLSRHDVREKVKRWLLCFEDFDSTVDEERTWLSS